jgi:hypothetical protein
MDLNSPADLALKPGAPIAVGRPASWRGTVPEQMRPRDVFSELFTVKLHSFLCLQPSLGSSFFQSLVIN